MFEKTYIYPNGEHLLRGYLVNDPKPDLGNASVRIFYFTFNFLFGVSRQRGFFY